MLTVFILQGCESEPIEEDQLSPPEFVYSSFEDQHLTHWDDIDQLEDGVVFLYYYSPYCDYCKLFEPTITEFAYENSDDIIIYFVNSSQIVERGEPDFELFNVPALIKLEDQIFVEMIRGLSNIEDYLQEFSNNSK